MNRLFDLSKNDPLDPPPIDYDRRYVLGVIGIIALAVLLALIASCSTPTRAYADTIKDKDAIKAVIGEAENQTYKGMLYVACALRNRGTLKGVYGLKSYRVVHHLYSDHIYKEATLAWKESAIPEVCKVVHNAIGWEDVRAFGTPYWAKSMRLVLTFKDHNFYAKN